MSQEIVLARDTQVIKDNEAAEKALAIMTRGDLSLLTPPERAEFVAMMAKSIGLNPLTKPVELLKNKAGQLVPYYNKGATDQLRAIHNVNLEVLERSSPTPTTYAVRVGALLPSGRRDEDIGVVVLTDGMPPEEQANAIMRCTTKAKRRATLSILGLGMLDESELDTVIPIFQQQLQNAPRMLSAPPQAQAVGQVGVQVIQPVQASPGASEEVEASVVAKPQAVAPKPAVASPSLPKALSMGKRLPVAPPVVIK